MSNPDLNLLIILDAVLSEGSVVRAAKRLRLSPSAMSRALARLRESTGDPLLVRAGRGLVPTPRAIELRDRVSQLVRDAQENFGPALIARVAEQAPGVRLFFMQKPDKDSKPLRDGVVDLETGVIDLTSAPELRGQSLFRDNYVGVVRAGHPLSRGAITPEQYAAGMHISVSREGVDKGSIDDALQPLGLERKIVTIVGGFSIALGLARGSDLIATVPGRHTASLREGMHSFPLPFRTAEFTVSLLWHPRFSADPAHRWLRSLVLGVCGKTQ